MQNKNTRIFFCFEQLQDLSLVASVHRQALRRCSCLSNVTTLRRFWKESRRSVPRLERPTHFGTLFYLFINFTADF